MRVLTESASKILIIKPSYNHSNGTGIAIFDEGSQKLVSCDLLFCSSERELADKTRQFWDHEMGAAQEPKILCIEFQSHDRASTKTYRSRLFSGILIALIEEKFSPKTTIRSTQQTSNKLNHLCIISKNTLSRKLLPIPKHHHSPILDAVALGLSMINKDQEMNQFIQAMSDAMHKDKIQCNPIHYSRIESNEYQLAQLQPF